MRNTKDATNVWNEDAGGIDRRGFLDCMRWVGTAVIWSFHSGVPVSSVLGAQERNRTNRESFSFVQISDSHIGFNKPANPNVTGTLEATVEKINGLEQQPDLVIHTGDITHLAKPSEFDTASEVLKGLRQKSVMYVPGEHDVTGDDGKQYLERFGAKTMGKGWYSFDHKGAHFIGLNNVARLEGMGRLGSEQLAWAKSQLQNLSKETPVIVFAHIPLWSIYPEWNWGTEDSAQLLALLKPFGSVTVLNGHIHQVMQKVEGSIAFHTAMSTAFPQPAPGSAPAPGPMNVPEDRLRSVLGVTEVKLVSGKQQLAIVDSPLGGM